jgi:hypothetical protein
MNSSSNRLSIRPDLPLDTLTAAVLLQVDALLRQSALNVTALHLSDIHFGQEKNGALGEQRR